MKRLFVSAEAWPYVKTGGLGDMAHALPEALAKNGPITRVLPLYASIDRQKHGIEPLGRSLRFCFGNREWEVSLFSAEGNGADTLFLYHPLLCDRPHPYGPPGGDYEDNDLRFSLFCHAVAAYAKAQKTELVHLNDWHTALAAPLLKRDYPAAKVVYTIHNLAYQGIFPIETAGRCGIEPAWVEMETMEFYGQVNWMKGGIAFADAVTTVSPAYAAEIQTPAYGCGLDGFLRKHAGKLHGILNGIDTRFFNPAADPALPYRYTPKSLANKRRVKKRFLTEAGLNDDRRPLFVFIGRLVEQKGADLLAEALDALLKRPLNLAVLGEGEARYQEAFAARNGLPGFRFFAGYDEALSHRLYAASDFLLMPSRFEPCGLNQMIAMRYGAVPVVNPVGGLADTVHPVGAQRCGEGIRMESPDATSLIQSVDTALALYGRSRRYNAVRRFDMACDFSIERCARAYETLYGSLT
ncbi:MAG: glycogen synthase [Epsilonproteobacteria bacterium]|nr:glycogen synthase [Campylobacterota bacterium]